MTKDEALKMSLEALESSRVFVTTREKIKHPEGTEWYDQAITAIKEELAQPEQEPVLQDIEQYRMQMAGICTAALGYWTEYDSISSDYDTVALRDVAKLYAKYDELYQKYVAQPEQEPVAWISHNAGLYHFKPDESLEPLPLYITPPAAQRQWVGLTDEEISATSKGHMVRSTYARAIESKLKEKNT